MKNEWFSYKMTKFKFLELGVDGLFEKLNDLLPCGVSGIKVLDGSECKEGIVYVFVCMSDIERKKTLGVFRTAGLYGLPTCSNPSIISEKEIELACGDIKYGIGSRIPTYGSFVEMISGYANGMKGFIVGFSGTKKCNVLLKMYAMQKEISVDFSEIKVIGSVFDLVGRVPYESELRFDNFEEYAHFVKEGK